MKQPTVYILASGYHGTLYTGVTGNLIERIWTHKHGLVDGFSKKYHVHNLVYFEQHSDMETAIEREKRIKAWKREWKVNLIEKSNPRWLDLFNGLQ